MIQLLRIITKLKKNNKTITEIDFDKLTENHSKEVKNTLLKVFKNFNIEMSNKLDKMNIKKLYERIENILFIFNTSK